MRYYRRGWARSLPRAGESAPTCATEVRALGKIIAIANQKGGVGKTTCAINLGGALAELGHRVLCVDLDPQANLSVGLGVDITGLERSIADVLVDDDVPLASVVQRTTTERLDCVPATIDLSAAELELFTAIGREMALKDKMTPEVVGRYDYLLIDCPPTLGLLTVNALVASDGVIIPVQTQYYALKGVAALLKMVRTVQSKLNPRLAVVGILPTFYDTRTILAREMLESLRDLGDHNVFHTVIRQWIKLGEAPTAGVPITRYDARSDAAKSFLELAREVTTIA